MSSVRNLKKKVSRIAKRHKIEPDHVFELAVYRAMTHDYERAARVAEARGIDVAKALLDQTPCPLWMIYASMAA